MCAQTDRIAIKNLTMLAKVYQKIYDEDKFFLVEHRPLPHQVCYIILNGHSSSLHQLSRLQLLLGHLPQKVLAILCDEEIKHNLSSLRSPITYFDLLHKPL